MLLTEMDWLIKHSIDCTGRPERLREIFSNFLFHWKYILYLEILYKMRMDWKKQRSDSASQQKKAHIKRLTQKMRFSMKCLYSKSDRILRKLRILSQLPKII